MIRTSTGERRRRSGLLPRRLRIQNGLSATVVRLPGLRQTLARFPARRRPALYFETLSNVGTGAYLTMFQISLVVLQTILNAELWHQALLAALFFGSSLLSLFVTYGARWASMRSLVVYPNLVVAAMLFVTALPWVEATTFTLLIGGTFLVRTCPRVAEMNMFRVLYPTTHRSTAVGWVKAVSAISGLSITFLSWWWFDVQPNRYWGLYCLVGVLLTSAALAYAQIPVNQGNGSLTEEMLSPWAAFRRGMRAFFSDRRFVFYQVGFAIGGIANHIGLFLIPRVMQEDAHAGDAMVGFVVAVLPTLLVVLSSPLWGRVLDRMNPMTGRAMFNTLQFVAFVLYAAGGLQQQVWLIVAGAVFHALSNGGGVINWLTGSNYFARHENASLYNGVHVFLTGIRGFIGPPIALFLFIDQEQIAGRTIQGLGIGAWVFMISAGLSIAAACMLFYQGATDPGPAE